MNKLDKLVAQRNGRGAGLPPFHKYVIVYEPKANERLKLVKEGNKYFVEFKNKNVNTAYSPSYVATPSNRIEIDTQHLNFKYNIYYDDPQEIEEERLEMIENAELNDENYKSDLNKKIKLYDDKAELTFEKEIKKLDYSYKPLSEQDNEENLNKDEEKADEVEQTNELTEPQNEFFERIKHLLVK